MAEEKKQEKNTGMAVVAYILFFIPLLTDAKKDPFVKYHIKQGLGLFIVEVGFWILSTVMERLFFIWGIIGLGLFILWILGIFNAVNGKKEPLPLIGQFAEKINI